MYVRCLAGAAAGGGWRWACLRGVCTYLWAAMCCDVVRRWINEIPAKIYVPADWHRGHTRERAKAGKEINFAGQ